MPASRGELFGSQPLAVQVHAGLLHRPSGRPGSCPRPGRVSLATMLCRNSVRPDCGVDDVDVALTSW